MQKGLQKVSIKASKGSDCFGGFFLFFRFYDQKKTDVCPDLTIRYDNISSKMKGRSIMNIDKLKTQFPDENACQEFLEFVIVPKLRLEKMAPAEKESTPILELKLYRQDRSETTNYKH